MGKQDRVRTRPGGAHWVLWQWPRCAAWQKALCAERGAESPRPPAQPQSGTRENQQSKDVLGLMHRMASALRDCKTLKRTSRIKCSFTLFKKTDHNIPSLGILTGSVQNNLSAPSTGKGQQIKNKQGKTLLPLFLFILCPKQ